jgi:hypothetical protein
MGTGVGLRQVGYVDCAGGGQVVVVDGIAYVGHMRSPHGASVIDVRDPRNCRELAKIGMPPGTHSHKVRVGNGLMVVNHEINGADPGPVPAEHFLPDVPPSTDRVSSNDVTVDDRGLIYLIDRQRGLTIVERI